MAKSEKEKEYVKLGPKAASFSCPTTGFNLVTKEQVKELVPTAAASKKVIVALRGGHLVYAKPGEVEAALAIAEDDEPEVLSEAFLNTKTKATLVPMALEVLEEDDEEDEADIEGMKKAELIEFILSKNETK